MAEKLTLQIDLDQQALRAAARKLEGAFAGAVKNATGRLGEGAKPGERVGAGPRTPPPSQPGEERQTKESLRSLSALSALSTVASKATGIAATAARAGVATAPTAELVGAASGVLGSAAQGAALGGMIGGPVGAAIGATVGTAAGFLEQILSSKALDRQMEGDRLRASSPLATPAERALRERQAQLNRYSSDPVALAAFDVSAEIEQFTTVAAQRSVQQYVSQLAAQPGFDPGRLDPRVVQRLLKLQQEQRERQYNAIVAANGIMDANHRWRDTRGVSGR